MKKSALLILLIVCFSASYCLAQAKKHKVIIMTDIGGTEPDDQQSLVRLLLYANELDIIGLIGSNSQYGINRGDTKVINDIIDAYEKVLPNLRSHASGYPSGDYLKSVVYEGQRNKTGMEGVGLDFSTKGSRYIIEQLLNDENDAIWFLAWGGTNTLAQALWETGMGPNQLTKSEIKKIEKKIKVYDIAGQDDSGAWIAHHFKEIFYLRSAQQFAAFSYRHDFTGHKSQHGNLLVANNEWFDVNVQCHGELGKKYPDAVYMYEGDTPSFLYLINNGLSDPFMPNYGSWGGRFNALKTSPPERNNGNENPNFLPAFVYNNAADEYYFNGENHHSVYVPLWRWRNAYQNDFAARIKWSLSDNYQAANHAPKVVVNQDESKDIVFLKSKPGNVIKLNAGNSSDPDGNQLFFNWWNYSEPGTYQNSINIEKNDEAVVEFRVPADAQTADSIHIVLEVCDNGTPRLTSYRRVVVIVD
jgi:hypothetical protein